MSSRSSRTSSPTTWSTGADLRRRLCATPPTSCGVMYGFIQSLVGNTKARYAGPAATSPVRVTAPPAQSSKPGGHLMWCYVPIIVGGVIVWRLIQVGGTV